jgi:nucleotide-binding universal stress UspA family protein
MELKHIVVATDESDAGREAVRAALDVGSRASAQVSIVRVVAVEAVPQFAGVAEGTGFVSAVDDTRELARLDRWLRAGVLTSQQRAQVELGVAFGIPGIEICRYADDNDADLVVLGRKRHSPMMRLLLGDTADAVARRNRSASLFVPQLSQKIGRLLVALDGSERGLRVLEWACDLARQIGASVKTVTVEGTPLNEPLELAASLPLTRSTSLQGRVQEVLTRKGLLAAPLVVRRGDVVKEILAEAQETASDALIIGYHRGGPPGVLEAGSTARRLAHAAPCAVLTVPL